MMQFQAKLILTVTLLKERSERKMMEREERQRREHLMNKRGLELEPIERANMEKEELYMRSYLKDVMKKKHRDERHKKAREARMRKIKAKESKIRRLRMPRAPTEKMHNRATRLAKWYRHTRAKNRLRNWFALRRMSETAIARIYRGFKGRQIAKKLIVERDIKREREKRIKEFEEEERIREEKEAEEAEERRRRLEERHKERKLRKKIRNEIREKEQKKARKYVVKHMRKQIANRFESENMEKSRITRNSVEETKSSGQESSATSSSNSSVDDTSDESELNSSFDNDEKRNGFTSAKSHQKAKKNKMGKTSNKSRSSKYASINDGNEKPKHQKKKKKKEESLKGKYIVKSMKANDSTIITSMVSTTATMDVIDSVNRMNDTASRMIRSRNLGTAKTILIGAERMTQNMIPGALDEEFNEARSITLMRLGLVMNHEKDFEGGLVYLQKALKLNRTPAIMNNICSTLSAVGRHHEALNWALDAVDAAQYDPVQEALPVALHNLGIEYEALGEIDSAFVAFNRAKRLANNRFGIESELSRSIHHSLVIARRYVARQSSSTEHGGPLFSMPRPREQPARASFGGTNVNNSTRRKRLYEEDFEARINDY